MRLEFVDICGFRSFRERRRFEFGTGFTVISGRNGVGKSTIIDAIDFALTGSINKYRVQNAKGGGLSDHIWWVGEGQAEDHYVSLGIIDDKGNRSSLTRSKDGSFKEEPPGVEQLLINAASGQSISLRKLSDTTIIRDELISELSLDLSEQQRFASVLEAIAPVTGPDLSKKVANVTMLANQRANDAKTRLSALQTRLAQTLENLAVARNAMAQSPDAETAFHSLRSQFANLPDEPQARRQHIAQAIAEHRLSAAIVADLRPRLLTLKTELEAIEADAVVTAITDLDHRLTDIADSVAKLRNGREEHQAGLRAAEVENEELAHLALLIEHGEAYGLDQGHCPLCAAARTDAEFRTAIEVAKSRLAAANSKVLGAGAALAKLEKQLEDVEQQQRELQGKRDALGNRIQDAENEKRHLSTLLANEGCEAEPNDVVAVDRWLHQTQQRQVQAQEALVVLDSSDANNQVGTLERSASNLRDQIDTLSGEISGREVISTHAKQVEDLTKEFPNEILAEQFDAVMPLLKEFYRRLRPHADWDEIEYDFGGRIRATLNFYVGDRKNPQFLFSSGQRRATGLAFLLAVHLARHWANLRTLVLDDPVQHIDDYRALNLVEVLAAIRKTGQQVIVAVEDAALASLLTRRLRSSLAENGCLYELGTSDSGGTCVKEEYTLSPLPAAALANAQAS